MFDRTGRVGMCTVKVVVKSPETALLDIRKIQDTLFSAVVRMMNCAVRYHREHNCLGTSRVVRLIVRGRVYDEVSQGRIWVG